MATATITPDHDTILAEIFIAAPPERVFQALSDPAQLSQWWGERGLYRVTGGGADVRVGGQWTSEGVSNDGTTFRVEGEYLEVDPPRRLVYTWIASYQKQLKTADYWDLEPQSVHALHPSGPKKAGTGTLLKLRHQGFASAPPAAARPWRRPEACLRLAPGLRRARPNRRDARIDQATDSARTDNGPGRARLSVVPIMHCLIRASTAEVRARCRLHIRYLGG
jgi:uncharacterized protein YndB with AHSA1/START domain